MKLTGVLPLRNGVKLAYPFDMAIRSLQRACDDVIIGVDPGDDDTLDRVRAMGVNVVETRWDLSNHRGHDGRSDEIADQTKRLCDMVTDGWTLSLQADEVIHEGDVATIRDAIDVCDKSGASAMEMVRLYFYGHLGQYRRDWTVPLVRIFKTGQWSPDYMSGAMQFVPVGRQQKVPIGPFMYHYSRMGNPQSVADRVRNLDHFYHRPESIGQAAPYDFGTTRKLDTYVSGVEIEQVSEVLESFDVQRHPAEARRLYA